MIFILLLSWGGVSIIVRQLKPVSWVDDRKFCPRSALFLVVKWWAIKRVLCCEKQRLMRDLTLKDKHQFLGLLGDWLSMVCSIRSNV